MIDLYPFIYQCIVILIVVILYEWLVVRITKSRIVKNILKISSEKPISKKSNPETPKSYKPTRVVELESFPVSNEDYYENNAVPRIKRKPDISTMYGETRGRSRKYSSTRSDTHHKGTKSNFKFNIPGNGNANTRYPFSKGLSTISELAEQNGTKFNCPDEEEWIISREAVSTGDESQECGHYSRLTSPPPPVSTPVGYEPGRSPSSIDLNSQDSPHHEWNSYWNPVNGLGTSPSSTSATLSPGETTHYKSKSMSIQRNMDSLDLGKLDEVMTITMQDRMPLDFRSGENNPKSGTGTNDETSCQSSPACSNGSKYDESSAHNNSHFFNTSKQEGKMISSDAGVGSIMMSQEEISVSVVGDNEESNNLGGPNNYTNFRNFQKNPGIITGLQVSSSCSVYRKDRSSRQLSSHRTYPPHHCRRTSYNYRHGHHHRHHHHHGRHHHYRHRQNQRSHSHNGSNLTSTPRITSQVTSPLTEESIDQNGTTSTTSSHLMDINNSSFLNSEPPNTSQGRSSIPDPDQQLGKLEAYVGILKQQFKQGSNSPFANRYGEGANRHKSYQFKRRKKLYWYRKLWLRLRGEKWNMINEVK